MNKTSSTIIGAALFAISAALGNEHEKIITIYNEDIKISSPNDHMIIIKPQGSKWKDFIRVDLPDKGNTATVELNSEKQINEIILTYKSAGIAKCNLSKIENKNAIDIHLHSYLDGQKTVYLCNAMESRKQITPYTGF